MGVTLKAYTTKLLLQRSLAYLAYTELTIKEIAAALDFSSPFYFTRFIRKHTGRPPSELRTSPPGPLTG
jgi:AraC-like DNA-binding protein